MSVFGWPQEGTAQRGKTEAFWQTNVRDGKPVLVFSIPTLTRRVRTIKVGDREFDAPLDWPELQGLCLQLKVAEFLQSQGIEITPDPGVTVRFFEGERKEVWWLDTEEARRLAEGLEWAAEWAEEQAYIAVGELAASDGAAQE